VRFVVVLLVAFMAGPALAVDDSADMEMFEKWDRESKRIAAKYVPDKYFTSSKPNTVWAQMPRWVRKRLKLCIKTGVRIIAE
jgi:hypothetical protein